MTKEIKITFKNRVNDVVTVSTTINQNWLVKVIINLWRKLFKYTTKEYWISRSPAVVGVIIGLRGEDVFVLTEKRSAMMDEPNKWALVSGYLDWDESGYEGIVRETYEETSFYIPNYKDELIYDHEKQPFYVQTEPNKDAKQNVSLSYIFVYKFGELPMYVEEFEDKEIAQVKWLNLKTFLAEKDNMEWAFDHDERIEMAIEKFLSK